MSELPKGWIDTTLGSVCDARAGIGFPTEMQGRDSGQVPFCKVSDISYSVLNNAERLGSARHYISEDEVANLRGKLLPIGSTVFAKIGEALKLNRRAITTKPLLVDNNVMGLVPFDEVIVSKYLFYFMKTVRLEGISNATTVPAVRKSDIETITIPLAPLNEQKRIVAKLDELLPKVEACRQRLEKIPTILKRFRQSVLKAAVTGKLTEDWRKQQKKSLSPIPTMGQLQQIEDLPDEWGAFNLGDCVHNHDAHRKPIKASDRKLRQGQYPYYGASGVIDTIDGYTHDGDFVLIGEDGANLLTRSTPLAFMTSGKIWVNNHAHVLSGKAGLLNEFLAYVINGRDLQEYITGTAQPKLNQENMNRIPVPVPPIEEQYEIVRRVSCCLDHYKKMLERNDFCLTTLERCTASILQRAFQGQLVEQNGSDEPATVLLERMKSPVNLKSEKSSPKRQKLDRRGQLTATC